MTRQHNPAALPILLLTPSPLLRAEIKGLAERQAAREAGRAARLRFQEAVIPCLERDHDELLYRSLGIAFTRQGNIEKGARYYRLYLPLCTNADDRAKLQQLLDDYDARRR